MTREQLTAILTTTRDEDSLYRSDDTYIDWSSHTSDGRVFEVGDADGNTVQLDLSRTEIEMLVHRLAATLLADS